MSTCRDESHLRRATLTVPSDPKYMYLIRALTGAAAQVVGFDDTDANYIRLAVDEAVANVIRHAYEGDTTRRIDLAVTLFDDRIEVRVRDFGRQCDPAQIRSRDLDDIRPGGLGVHFIRQIMDVVVYDTKFSEGTELRMTKYLNSRKTAEPHDGNQPGNP